MVLPTKASVNGALAIPMILKYGAPIASPLNI